MKVASKSYNSKTVSDVNPNRHKIVRTPCKNASRSQRKRRRPLKFSCDPEGNEYDFSSEQTMYLNWQKDTLDGNQPKLSCPEYNQNKTVSDVKSNRPKIARTPCINASRSQRKRQQPLRFSDTFM